MRKIDTSGTIDAPIEILVEATRQIVIAALHAQSIDKQINIAPILRQVLFYVYEGGEQNKFLPKRPHSSEARTIRDNSMYYMSKCRSRLRYDHAIPLCILYERIGDYASDSVRFERFLRVRLQGVVITAEEDRRLNDAGLRMKMPLGSKDDDLLARYRAVGIAFGPDDEVRLTQRETN